MIKMTKCIICVRSLNASFDGYIDNDDLVYYTDKNGSYRPLSENNKLREMLKYEDCSNKVSVWADKKWGFASFPAGTLITRPIWDYAYDFHDGLALVCRGCKTDNIPISSFSYPEGGKWGAIDTIGDLIIPAEYDELWYIGVPESERVVARNGRKYGYISTDGEMLIPTIYDGMWIYPGIVVAAKEGFMGVLSKYNDEIIPFIYSRIIPIGEDSFICQEQDGSYLFLYGDEMIFSGVTEIYCADFRGKGSQRTTYMISEKDDSFALISDDGRMLSDFCLSFRDAELLAGSLTGKPIKFSRWL